VPRELTARAREGGLLGKLTQMAIEGALEGEMDNHLGYANHQYTPAGMTSVQHRP